MSNKKLVIAVIAILIIGLLLFLIIKNQSSINQAIDNDGTRNAKSPSRQMSAVNEKVKQTLEGVVTEIKKRQLEVVSESQTQTRVDIKYEIKTPEPEDVAPMQELAIPDSVARRNGYDTRTFVLKGKDGAFEPSILVVNEKDVLAITLKAEDGDYSINFPDFGISKTVKKNEQGSVQFGVRPAGQYRFYCNEVCGKKERAEGVLIVNGR